MEKADRDKMIKGIDKTIGTLENMVKDADEAIAKLRKLRDNLTGQTKLKTG